MLAHLRSRVVAALAGVQHATLSTYGPADIQAAELPCEALGLRLYLLTPRFSDHLFNLESNPDVVVTTEAWQLRGRAQVAAPNSTLHALALTQSVGAEWGVLVEITPIRIQLGQTVGAGHYETIDIDE